MSEPATKARRFAVDPPAWRLPPRLERILLAVVLLVAFALRAWFGSFDPTPRRFFDEIFTLENVGHSLRTGELAPQNGYHPSLSYLPMLVVLDGLQGIARLSRQPALLPLGPGRVIGASIEKPAAYPFRPVAYRVGRLFQALLGTLAVGLTFALGRMVGGPVTGLGAAALAAVAPQLVRQSSLINEDIGLVATVVLAVWTAARAGAEPTWRRALQAGAAVGLACSSKFNGVSAAIPMIAVTLLQARDRRAWLRLIGAGSIASAVFLALNPFVLLRPEMYQEDFGRTVKHYANKGIRQSETHGSVLLSAAATARDPAFLGAAGGTLALLGVLQMAIAAGSSRTERARRHAIIAALSFLAGYPLIYALATQGVMRHNWLPMLPLLCVAAAESLRCSAGLFGRRPRAALVAQAGASVVLGAIALSLLQTSYVWGVPTTGGGVAELLTGRLSGDAGRIVAMAGAGDSPLITGYHGRLVVRLPLAAAADVNRWQRFDAVLLRADAALTAPLVRELRERGAVSLRIQPRLGLRRGPAVEVLLQDWQPTTRQPPRALSCPAPDHMRADLPAPPGEYLSLAISAPSTTHLRAVRIGGVAVSVHAASRPGGRQLLFSERVPSPGGSGVSVQIEAACAPRLKVAVLGWHPRPA